MHGKPALEQGFHKFPYVNENAPKGGRLVLGAQGTFDTLNPFIIRGISTQGIQSYVVESLMERSWDEPFSLYGLIAEKIETPEDRSYATFFLNPKAQFSDGTPITARDVEFSYQVLLKKGRPNHRNFYSRITQVSLIDPHTIRFDFQKPYNRELPMIIGLMPILSKKHTSFDTFDETTLKPLIGSGPYVVGEVHQGKSMQLKRNPHYWGNDLPVNKGRYNFDEIRFDYFRDQNTLFEAFKVGKYDIRTEADPNKWLTQYDFPRISNGDAKKVVFENGLPKPLSAFAFNMRRHPFDKLDVRKALIELFDAQWVNEKLFSGALGRTEGFFDGSELSSLGRRANDFEMALLTPFQAQLDPMVLDGTYRAPRSNASGRDRDRIKIALEYLKKAGYEHKDGVMAHNQTQQKLSFEILVSNKSDERLALVYSHMLERVGIEAKVRVVDSVQYEGRRQTFDFDMMPIYLPGSASPGLEQTYRWGSKAAGQNGSFNFSGLESEAADAAITKMLEATSRDEFISSVKALDRILISQHPVLPLFHIPGSWVSVNTRLGIPEKTPLFGYVIDAWWDKSRELGKQ